MYTQETLITPEKHQITPLSSDEKVQQEMKEVEISHICVNPFQPRHVFSQEELEDLASSIKAVGLIHPPVVRPLPNGTYELISGERRFRAAQLAGLKKIPVIVRHTNSSLSAQAALIENVQRVDLNPIEIAHSMRRLMDQFGLTQDDLAKRIGKKRSTVANYLRVLALPQDIQNSLAGGEINMGHAKVILSLEGSEKQHVLFEKIRQEDYTVRQAELAALRLSNKVKLQDLTYTNRDFYLEYLAEQIQQKLGTKVTIQSKGTGGRVCIDYYSLDDLDRLLELLGVKEQL